MPPPAALPQQVVLLVQVLTHEINHGYRYSVVPCKTFNGKKFSNLRMLSELVDACDHRWCGQRGRRTIALLDLLRQHPITETDASSPTLMGRCCSACCAHSQGT